MIFIATNFAKSTLAGSIGSGATSLAVQAGDGALFPNPSASQQFAVVLANAATPNAPPFEIVYCTARSGDTLTTIVRAQEGTTAQNWPAGAVVSHRLTAGTLWQGSGAAKQTDIESAQIGLTTQTTLPFTYFVLQTTSFTFPSVSPTGAFGLDVTSAVSFGAGINAGGTPGKILYAQVRQRVVDTTNSIDLIPIVGYLAVADEVVGAGSEWCTTARAGRRGLGPNYNADVVAPAGGPAGPVDTTLLYTPGATIILQQLACCANTGSNPIPGTSTIAGRLILTATPA